MSSPNICRFPAICLRFTGHNQALTRPPGSHQLDYEGEVAIVIGKKGRRIAEEDAYDHISALTLCNEGTIRDCASCEIQRHTRQNWDNSGAIGPWLVPFTNAAQLDEARIITRVNGEIRQDDRLSRMMHPFEKNSLYFNFYDIGGC